jgi:Putative helix-turn-helix protein, YlxM / p13 like.
MSPKTAKPLNEHEIIELLMKKISRDWYNLGIIDYCFDLEGNQEAINDLTAQEIINKINDFLEGNPNEAQATMFLVYLSKFPQSLCQRPISKALEYLIGFHYRLSGEKDQEGKQHQQLSMDELATIFRRSKASIHECVKNTKNLWKEYQKQLQIEEEQEILTIAKRELIEEAKEKLRAQDRPQTAYPLAIIEKIQT